MYMCASVVSAQPRSMFLKTYLEHRLETNSPCYAGPLSCCPDSLESALAGKSSADWRFRTTDPAAADRETISTNLI